MNPAATLLLLGMVLGSGSSWAQDAPAVPQAVIEQATVTTFTVRAERARILADAREGWWSGDLPLVEGYPQASSRDWMSPTVLRGRLLVLDVQAQQRASEALAATDQEALVAAMQAAHREEERNDSLERRLGSALP